MYMPKMHQNTFGGRALPGPAGELKALLRPLTRNRRVVLLRGGQEGEGKG